MGRDMNPLSGDRYFPRGPGLDGAGSGLTGHMECQSPGFTTFENLDFNLLYGTYNCNRPLDTLICLQCFTKLTSNKSSIL